MSKLIQITAADGHTLSAYYAKTQGECRGAIVIIQEIFGLTPQLQSLADQYAKRGFEVIVPALFDRISKDTVIEYAAPQEGLALVNQCDSESVLLDIQAAVSASTQIKVSVVGFCWGGGIALLAACKLNLHKGVAFYATRLQSYLSESLTCPFQFHFAELDKHSPESLLASIQHQFPAAEMHRYKGVDHAFANHHKASFHEEAAMQAMQRTIEFISN